MTLHKTSLPSLIKTTLMGVSVMAVAACTNYGPYPLATGYKYQQLEYKSAAGPEPVTEHYTRRNDAPDTVQTHEATRDTASGITASATQANVIFHWNNAADELVSRLITNFGQPMETVYITTPETREAIGFSSALSHALKNHDITVTGRNDGAVFGANYTINMLDVGQPDRRLISLQLISAGQVIHEESGIYTVIQTTSDRISDRMGGR